MIATARLRLRRWRSEDLAPFAELNADPEVMEHFPAPLDVATSDLLAERVIAHFERYGFGPWAVEIPGVTEFAGFVGLMTPTFDAHFTPCVEIGWRLARAVWGQGYATEAARAAIGFGFEELEFDQIIAMTVPANLRSRSVMERLGMGSLPADDFDHPQLPVGHVLRRHVLYRLRRADWFSSAGTH
jgi:RimJ/RimL family protein N-acetyltransferase